MRDSPPEPSNSTPRCRLKGDEKKCPQWHVWNAVNRSLLTVTQRGSKRGTETSWEALEARGSICDCHFSILQDLCPRFPSGLLVCSASDLPQLSAVFNPCWDPGHSDETFARLPIAFPMLMLGLASHVLVISLFSELIYSIFRSAIAFRGLVVWVWGGLCLFGCFVSATLLGLRDFSSLSRVGTQTLSGESRVLTTELPGNSLMFLFLYSFSVCCYFLRWFGR